MKKLEKLAPSVWLESMEQWAAELEHIHYNLEKYTKSNLHLRIDNTKKGPQYYLIEKKGDTHGKYIPKSKMENIKKLAQQEYNVNISKIVVEEHELVKNFIQTFKKLNTETFYQKLNSQRKTLIEPLTLPPQQLIELWKSTKETATFMEEYIWEHLGLMDSKDYAAKNVTKIAEYEHYGYFPGKNLITTMETKDLMLTPQRIEKLAREFLV